MTPQEHRARAEELIVTAEQQIQLFQVQLKSLYPPKPADAAASVGIISVTAQLATAHATLANGDTHD